MLLVVKCGPHQLLDMSVGDGTFYRFAENVLFNLKSTT